MANFDVTIKSSNGEITFWGSRRNSDGSLNKIGYNPPMDGLGEPGRRTTTSTKSGADGGLVVSTDQQYDIRTITMDAWAICETYDEIRTLESKLASSMPIRQMVDVYVDTPLNQRLGCKALVTKASPSVPYSKGGILVMDISIELIAPDPYFLDYTSGSAFSVKLHKASAGGLLWNASGLAWSASELPWSAGSGDNLVVNTGQEDVYPRIYIRGTVHNPEIANVGQDKAVRLNLTTSSDDEVILDLSDEIATLNGANIRFNINDASEWWSLTPGNNTISYKSDSVNDDAEIELVYYPRYARAI